MTKRQSNHATILPKNRMENQLVAMFLLLQSFLAELHRHNQMLSKIIQVLRKINLIFSSKKFCLWLLQHNIYQHGIVSRAHSLYIYINSSSLFSIFLTYICENTDIYLLLRILISTYSRLDNRVYSVYTYSSGDQWSPYIIYIPTLK